MPIGKRNVSPMTYDITRLRILVVDDSVNMRQIIRRILRIFGLREVYEAADGVEALDVMSSALPDIILTNWEMLPMNGLEFVRAVRSREKSLATFMPIIMISGYTDLDRVVEARNAGVNEFMAKPLSAKSLYTRILRIIDKPRRYVDSGAYFGPDRRIKAGPFEGRERRAEADSPADARNDNGSQIDWVDS